ncbi:MAG: hypothetical protein KJ923_00040 [Candidatus Omnitrophica bacterium]|nr:hypothetical protein [Candidatus Omnitrophota bacterium]MBU1905375.1 hypothetical protein [Candidatus Omnitrophota bacterium]
MKKITFLLLILILGISFTIAFCEGAPKAKGRVILFISEQNIAGPERAWWAGEVDLSTIEIKVAQSLQSAGYEVMQPSNLSEVIKEDKAFRIIDLSLEKTLKLGNLSGADYVVLGKAIASCVRSVPQSNMQSCNANVSGKLIRANDGEVVSYLEASGVSVHLDEISGGREALGAAGKVLAEKVIEALDMEGDR